jgi:hypothetical protein
MGGGGVPLDFGGGGRRPSPVAGMLVAPATEEVEGWRCSLELAAGILTRRGFAAGER